MDVSFPCLAACAVKAAVEKLSNPSINTRLSFSNGMIFLCIFLIKLTFACKKNRITVGMDYCSIVYWCAILADSEILWL